MCNCGKSSPFKENHSNESSYVDNKSSNSHHSHHDKKKCNYHKKKCCNKCYYVSCFNDRIVTPYELWLESCKYNTKPCPKYD